MSIIAEIIGKIFKAIFSALLEKPIEKTERYRDVKGDSDTDTVFDDNDW